MKSIPLIAEHDTWTSVDPVIGCPADCAYCFVRKFGETNTKPKIRYTPKETVESLVRWLEGPDIPLTTCRPHIAALGNYTDMLMTQPTRKFTLEYAALHHDSLPHVPLVLITKARLSKTFVSELDSIGQTILLFVSQSFFGRDGLPSGPIEKRTATVDETAENIALVASTTNICPLHFWRPVTRKNVPDETHARRQVRLVAQAGCLASVAVGLKFGEHLSREFASPGNPFYEEFASHGNCKIDGEMFESDLRKIVLHAGLAEEYPVYLNTSCAVSFALRMPEILQTFRPPLRSDRCLPCSCPGVQRHRCDTVDLSQPDTAELTRVATDVLCSPADTLNWDRSERRIDVFGSLSQDTLCHLSHLTGHRVHAMGLYPTREWVGTLGGQGGGVNDSAIMVTERALGGRLAKSIERMKSITGMVSPLAKADDLRPRLFSRYGHVRRVAVVAGGLAYRASKHGGTVDLERVIRLAWLHDLNRWPFAHNAEKGLFDQIADLERFFAPEFLNEDDLADLRSIHLRTESGTQIEGRLVLAADRSLGVFEDILLAVIGLGIDPTFVPNAIAGLISFRFDDRLLAECTRSRNAFMKGDVELAESEIERLATAHAISFAWQHCDEPGQFRLKTSFADVIARVKRDFLVSRLFPLVNEEIGHARFISDSVIRPLIEVLPQPVDTLTSVDEREAIDLAIQHGIISDSQREAVVADLDFVARHRPDIALRTDE